MLAEDPQDQPPRGGGGKKLRRAVQLILGGAADEDFHFAPEEFEIIYSRESETGKAFVRRGDIPDLLADELVSSAWTEWRRWKRLGWPHGRGPAGERAVFTRAIEICEQEYDLWLTEERTRD